MQQGQILLLKMVIGLNICNPVKYMICQTTVSALALKEAEVVRLLEELEAKDVVNQDLQRQQLDKEGELELAGGNRMLQNRFWLA